MTPVITPAFEKVVYSLHAQRIVVKEGGSCTDALIMIQHKVCKFLDDTNCVAVTVFTMGFSKAFNSLTNLKASYQTYILSIAVQNAKVVYNNVNCDCKHVNTLSACKETHVRISPGLVNFPIKLVNFVLNLRDGQVLFFRGFQITEGL